MALTTSGVGDAAAGRDISALPTATAAGALPTPRSQWDGKAGAKGPGLALLIPAPAQTKSSTDRREDVGDPRGTGGCCAYFEARRAEDFALHEQQGTDWLMARFRWLLFPTEELSSTANQAVTLCKTHTRLLIASQKPRSNPAPHAPERNLLKSTCAANHKGFPLPGRCSRGTWDIALWQAGSLLHKVPTWLELVVLPSTGSSTRPVFLATVVLCREVLISFAGC